MSEFQIVLFKDKKRKKIIKKFKTFERASNFLEEYKKNNDKIQFEKEFVNGKKSNYEIGLVQIGKNPENFTYLKDEMGRNIKIVLDEKNMTLIKIFSIKTEELIYDYQSKRKIGFENFQKKYLKNKNLKLISGLNNKVVVQEEDLVNLFILKNELETNRFLEVLSDFLFKNKRSDCIVVKDSSLIQRKQLYNFLESLGYDKTFLYRKFTCKIS